MASTGLGDKSTHQQFGGGVACNWKDVEGSSKKWQEQNEFYSPLYYSSFVLLEKWEKVQSGLNWSVGEVLRMDRGNACFLVMSRMVILRCVTNHNTDGSIACKCASILRYHNAIFWWVLGHQLTIFLQLWVCFGKNDGIFRVSKWTIKILIEICNRVQL